MVAVMNRQPLASLKNFTKLKKGEIPTSVIVKE